MFVKTPRITEFYSKNEIHKDCIRFVQLESGELMDYYFKNKKLREKRSNQESLNLKTI
jgi:hypothetical protein